MSKEQAWFHEGEWLVEEVVKAHASINITEFYSHFHTHPNRWKAVFDFLRKDLKSLAPGKYPLLDDQVFALVSEYLTKKPEEAKWEAHRKYIDLQYLIDGEEKMGLLPFAGASSPQPYDEARDLIFFGDQEGEYFTANPMSFFLFFPEDVHRPGMLVEESKPVKKLVIKIAVSE
jgi:YhcH/YjgK/YiaL family protein